MTTLTITPDVAKKRLKLDGVIAAGEKVIVTVAGFGDKSTLTTRLRVLCCDKLIAQFPMPQKAEEEQEQWTVSEGDLTSVLSLNTVQAEKMTRCGGCSCLFILDDVSDEVRQLYGSKDHNVGQWVKNHGTDVPINLDEWPNLLDEVWRAINGFKTQINDEWREYRSDLSLAWNNYKANINSLYQQFTQNVSTLIADKATKGELTAHVNNKNNPHDVRIAQIPQLRSELNNLGSRITNESTARENADNSLREAIVTEQNRALSKENQLAGAIVGENSRAKSAEDKLDLDIRMLGNRVKDEVKVLRGKTYAKPITARGWYLLIGELITALGGNIETDGIVPSTNPRQITFTAEDGTIRSLSIVKSDDEYTSIVR